MGGLLRAPGTDIFPRGLGLIHKVTLRYRTRELCTARHASREIDSAGLLQPSTILLEDRRAATMFAHYEPFGNGRAKFTCETRRAVTPDEFTARAIVTRTR